MLTEEELLICLVCNLCNFLLLTEYKFPDIHIDILLTIDLLGFLKKRWLFYRSLFPICYFPIAWILLTVNNNIASESSETSVSLKSHPLAEKPRKTKYSSGIRFTLVELCGFINLSFLSAYTFQLPLGDLRGWLLVLYVPSPHPSQVQNCHNISFPPNLASHPSSSTEEKGTSIPPVAHDLDSSFLCPHPLLQWPQI